MTRRQRLHAALFAGVMVALTVGGYVLAATISQPPATAATLTRPGSTIVHTHVLTKKVRGHVVTLKSGVQIIRIPTVVIRNLKCHPSPSHHCIRRVVVPAHSIPLRAATENQPVAVAAPLAPVTVYATVTDTVTTPAVTVTQTQTVTLPQDTVTVTITVPLTP